MSSLYNAFTVQDNQTVTENGMTTLKSSSNPLVDLFFAIGSSRKKDITDTFHRAYLHDRVLALRILFWARDVRQGAGERSTFRNLIKFLEETYPVELEKLIPLIPEFGRYDDLFIFEIPTCKQLAFSVVKDGLLNPNPLVHQLAAKWSPREKSAKSNIANEFRNFLNMKPKQYRKMLAALTAVVENKMCAKEWQEIKYGNVPSVAAARYQKAFNKHDPAGYAEYRAKLLNGTEKVNAGAVYPYDVIKSIRMGGDSTVANAQWDSLPNYTNGQNILPIVDVSGSMTCNVGGSNNLTCLDVSVSLGLYLADKNTGKFKNMFMTFSSTPEMKIVKGKTLLEKYNYIVGSNWGMSTDLNAAFDLLLSTAIKHKVSHSEMPETILIFSDMQFNQCVTHNDSAIEMIRRKYTTAGYELPKVVFWQLNSKPNNTPVTYDNNGTALVSGFSPSLIKSILTGKDFSPLSLMLDVINTDRYLAIQ